MINYILQYTAPDSPKMTTMIN